LRQVNRDIAARTVHLYAPERAWRVRWNMNTDTPLPPDEPRGQNPPDGAIINYWLGSDTTSDLTLEILDSSGRLVRKYSSTDAVPPVRDTQNWPAYWIRPERSLPTAAGMHRVMWDLHYPPPHISEFSYPIAAVPGNTPREPRGPWAAPGAYTVRLTAASTTVTAPLILTMDPRVKTPPADLQQQLALSMRLYDAIGRVNDRLQAPDDSSAGAERADLEALRTLRRRLLALYETVQGADVAPTPQVVRAAEQLLADDAMR
jgi:hypothetical protein